MTFTKQDVENALNDEQFESYSEWAKRWSIIDAGDWYELSSGKGRVTINDTEYEWESVKHIGDEGQGEYAAVIFSIDGRLFRKEGYYASHYGTDWDGDLDEVEVYEKIVTDYRPI